MIRKFLLLFLSFLVLLSGVSTGFDDRTQDSELRSYIDTLCREKEIPPELVYAVVERESTWDADACNVEGNCIGLMQIAMVNLSWLREELGINDLYDPYQNVLAGVTMLASYVKRYDDYHLALICYNCGEGGAQRLFEQGVFSTSYSRWIVARMEELCGKTEERTFTFREDKPTQTGHAALPKALPIEATPTPQELPQVYINSECAVETDSASTNLADAVQKNANAVPKNADAGFGYTIIPAWSRINTDSARPGCAIRSTK